MKKNYEEIEFGAGYSIESALKMLKSHNEPVCGSFNGKMLYSDDDIDSAYKKITGKTKAEADEAERKWHEEYEEEERKHKESIPRLTEEWIEKGKDVLDDKYHELWIECVPIRLNDLYRGMELSACLEIVKKLNDGCRISTARKIIKGQGHSGMSFGLVCSMIKSFCDRGVEFVNFVEL